MTLADGVTSIGRYAFRGCENLTDLNLGRDLASIGDYAFYGCTSLKRVVLPTALKHIGAYAFRGCRGLTSLVIPASVETVGKHAFYGMDQVTLYCEAESIPAYWNERWNSSYRAVLWGVGTSEEGFVESFTMTETATENLTAPDASLSPRRAGYTFVGWATETGSDQVVYAPADLASCPVGTTLYAVWIEGEPVEEPETEESEESETTDETAAPDTTETESSADTTNQQ